MLAHACLHLASKDGESDETMSQSHEPNVSPPLSGKKLITSCLCAGQLEDMIIVQKKESHL